MLLSYIVKKILETIIITIKEWFRSEEKAFFSSRSEPWPKI